MIITDTWRRQWRSCRGAARCANETLKLADAAQLRSLNEIAKFLCLFYARGKLKKKPEREREKSGKAKRKMMMQPCHVWVSGHIGDF